MHKTTGLLMALLIVAGAPALGAEMKYPDFEAQWRNPTAGRGGNPWDTTKPMGLGQEPPLTPEYQAIFEASVREQKKGGQGNSRGSTCILPGMPKVMNFSEPMEIIIRPHITYFVPMRYPTRRIYTDGGAWAGRAADLRRHLDRQVDRPRRRRPLRRARGRDPQLQGPARVRVERAAASCR